MLWERELHDVIGGLGDWPAASADEVQMRGGNAGIVVHRELEDASHHGWHILLVGANSLPNEAARSRWATLEVGMLGAVSWVSETPSGHGFGSFEAQSYTQSIAQLSESIPNWVLWIAVVNSQ
jgi:hypothetical protein